ncbi:hypothetical protein H2200_003000 [Cladophialophora chaetospira]|uniref:Heterokaryon incompatibility domain-containing protein n=1 Tax=Cladophialophora chaetospira TaxID=386627 RepID=A0AA38XHD8_9EURO|nr:hypothetical protein H2200_003000 [Cladophialophora chaetospira]
MGYIYEPLRTKHSIRLIKLLGRTPTGLVSCTLEQYEIDRAPPYRALSYYWGSPAPTDEISLGSEGSLMIHKNLWHFLDQMVLDNRAGHYWTDALCIDQKSVEEKNHQVAYMGEVYRQAREVIMWLGRERRAQDSMSILFEHVAMSPRHRCGRQRDLADLLAVPYWKRLWVVQEIALARSVLVICGSVSLRKKDFTTALIRCAEDTYTYFQDQWVNLQASRTEQRDSDIGPPATVSQVLRLVTLERKQQPLWQLISTFSQGICSDPRDKVFGLLGLRSLPHLRSTMAEGSPIMVDYHRSLNDMFWDVIFNCPVPEDKMQNFILELSRNMSISLDRIPSSLGDYVSRRDTSSPLTQTRDTALQTRTTALHIARTIKPLLTAPYSSEDVYGHDAYSELVSR